MSVGVRKIITGLRIKMSNARTIKVYGRLRAIRTIGPRGITANVVAPGAIQTDFADGIVRESGNQQARRGNDRVRTRWVPGDIGPMIAALLSDDNGWVNGQRIEVSGGMSL
jgi:NAD(P)-dependent dehydrogenase (short-subunit alcohol dehydrogenase family)